MKATCYTMEVVLEKFNGVGQALADAQAKHRPWTVILA
jgi:hypothetical protein